MGIHDKFLGYLKDKKENVVDNEIIDEGILKFYSFTSLVGGAGSTFLIQYLAQYLAKEEDKQVCVVDLNFNRPDLLYQFNVDVTEEKSLLNFLKGFKGIKDCYIADKDIPNLHVATVAPTDSLMSILSLEDERPFHYMYEELEAFDYVLINMPYNLATLGFVTAVPHIDKGFVISDERLSGVRNLEILNKHMGKFHGTHSLVNKVILNKRTDYDYPFEHLENAGGVVVADIGTDDRLVHYMNDNSVLYKKELSDSVVEGLEDVWREMTK